MEISFADILCRHTTLADADGNSLFKKMYIFVFEYSDHFYPIKEVQFCVLPFVSSNLLFSIINNMTFHHFNSLLADLPFWDPYYYSEYEVFFLFGSLSIKQDYIEV